MPTVESSAIRRIGYDEATRELRVVFAETGAYTYFAVPKHIYEEFLRAPSKGQFFNAHIRDRYPFHHRASGPQ